MEYKDLQVENGNFTRIINPLIDELIKIPFKGCEIAVALFIIRKTYGYNKKQDEISITQFEKALNKSRPVIIKALKNLQLVNVAKLVKRGDSKKCSNIWEINKYIDKWQLVKVAKLVKHRHSTSKASSKQLVKGAKHTKDNIQKTITKDISSKEDKGKALTTEKQEKKDDEQYGNALINSFIDSLKGYNQTQALDGTIKGNRFAAKRVIDKIRKEFKARTKRDPSDNEIICSMRAILEKADEFHQKNLTNFEYLDKHFYQIIKSSFQRGIVKI